MTRPFRFGVSLHDPGDGKEWAQKCRLAESMGFDVILVSDHLRTPAPFAALTAAALATEHVTVGSYVLNTGFWNPRLLAREVATVQALTNGRFEVGLGAGYAKEEFDEAGLPFEPASARVAKLRVTLEMLTGPAAQPTNAVGIGPAPILVGGGRPQVLGLAARYASTVAISTLGPVPDGPEGAVQAVPAATVRDRVASVRAQAGPRADEIEFNTMVHQILETPDRRAAAEQVQPFLPYLTVDELLDTPAGLIGTVAQMAEMLRERRDRYGFSYITVPESAMHEFAPVIEAVHGG